MDVQLFGADGRNKREKRRVVSGNVLPIAKGWTQNDLPAAGGRNLRHVHLCTMSGCSHSGPGVHFVYDPTMLQLKNNFPSHPTKATNHKNRFKKSSTIKRPMQTPNYSKLRQQAKNPPNPSTESQMSTKSEWEKKTEGSGFWISLSGFGVMLRPELKST